LGPGFGGELAGGEGARGLTRFDPLLPCAWGQCGSVLFFFYSGGRGDTGAMRDMLFLLYRCGGLVRGRADRGRPMGFNTIGRLGASMTVKEKDEDCRPRPEPEPEP